MAGEEGGPRGWARSKGIVATGAANRGLPVGQALW